MRTSGKPFVAITRFEIQGDLINLLPRDFMTHRGAIVYERIGKDLLVAVLNPFDTDLQEEIHTTTKRRCHFCLTNSTEYDNTLASIRKMQAASDLGA